MEHTIPKSNPPHRAPVDARVRRSRDELREALLGLLSSYSYDEITIRQITSTASVGYTTFFRHYSSKDELLETVIVAEIQQLMQHSFPIYQAADPQGACLALCDYVDQHRGLWAALFTGGAASKVRELMLSESRRSSTSHVASDGIPTDLGVVLSVAVLFELLAWWLRQSDPWPAQEIARILQRRMLPGS